MSRSLALATLTALSLLTATAAQAQAAAKPSTPAAAAAAPAKPATPPVAAKPATTAKLDLNTATQEELAALPGIGETLAAAIIQHRPYRSAGDLVSKKVIPEAAYQKIRSKVVAHHA